LEQGSCPPHRVLEARQGKQATLTGGLANFLRIGLAGAKSSKASAMANHAGILRWHGKSDTLWNNPVQVEILS
jgi:hypothetical protein